MTQVKVQLTDAMETSLIMLYGLAMDAHAKPTILGDTLAAQAFEKVDYDFTRLTTPLISAKNVRTSVAARAKHFDTWTTEFLAAHDQATVLQLGAGLDPRVWRVDPGPEVEWYDIDFPGVVEARGKLFPERANYRMIASSVTDPEWLDQIPADRPVLVIAQGLTMYLRPVEGHALFRRITDRFARGTLVLDTHNWLGVRGVNKSLKRVFGHRCCTGPSTTRTNWNESTRGCDAPTRSAPCPRPWSTSYRAARYHAVPGCSARSPSSSRRCATSA